MERPDDEFDKLLTAVGPERGGRSPEEVAAAEQRLKEMASAGPEETLRGMRRNGWVALGFGVALLLMFVAVLFDEDPLPLVQPGDPWYAYLGAAALYFMLVLSLAAGVLLVAGGLAFRQAREWARRAIAGVLTATIVYCAALGVVAVAVALSELGLTLQAVAMAAMGVAAMGVWVLILSYPLRYFRSERVRRICEASATGL